MTNTATRLRASGLPLPGREEAATGRDTGTAAAASTSRKLDDLMLSDGRGERLTRLEPRPPGTARARFEVQEVRR
jgi:hypothetical protein